MRLKATATVLAAGLITAGVWAQYGPRRGRAPARDRPEPTAWAVDPAFRPDVFTFVRIEHTSLRGWYGLEKWEIDYPDADWNLSFRLQQLTSLKVNPLGEKIRLTSAALSQYPFIYMVEPGDLVFSDDEVKALRRYLLSGGFLMADDFWGEREWGNFYAQIKRVLPEREFQELPLDHPIFHCVFDLKEKPQIPNVGLGTQSLIPGHPMFGITWERSDARQVHYRAFLDDAGRMMVMICHNTDLGDGWEREGDNELYFREFSEKKAYPLAINILFYTMTH